MDGVSGSVRKTHSSPFETCLILLESKFKFTAKLLFLSILPPSFSNYESINPNWKQWESPKAFLNWWQRLSCSRLCDSVIDWNFMYFSYAVKPPLEILHLLVHKNQELFCLLFTFNCQMCVPYWRYNELMRQKMQIKKII